MSGGPSALDPDTVRSVSDGQSAEVLENILSPGFPSDEGEHVFHLVQDESLITRIHNEELPPDSYYEELVVST